MLFFRLVHISSSTLRIFPGRARGGWLEDAVREGEIDVCLVFSLASACFFHYLFIYGVCACASIEAGIYRYIGAGDAGAVQGSFNSDINGWSLLAGIKGLRP